MHNFNAVGVAVSGFTLMFLGLIVGGLPGKEKLGSFLYRWGTTALLGAIGAKVFFG